MPEVFQSQMMRHLGINDAFLGNPMAGVRERGALTSLIKASFRKLESKVILIEEAFTDMDNYMLDYYDAHQDKFTKTFGLKSPEEYFVDCTLTATDKLVEFSNQDNSEEKNMTMNEYRSGLISQTAALKALGHKQPSKIIREQQAEALEREVTKARMQVQIREITAKDPITLVFEKLKGRLQNKFWTTPIEGGRVLVKVSKEDEKEASKLLLNISDQVLIQVEEVKEEAPAEQNTMEIIPVPVPEPEQFGGFQQGGAKPWEQGGNSKPWQKGGAKPSAKPWEKPAAPAEEASPEEQAALAEMMQGAQEEAQPEPQPEVQPEANEQEQVAALMAQLQGDTYADKAAAMAGEKGGAPFERSTNPDIAQLIAIVQKNKTKIQPTADMMRLPALYFNEPIAKNISQGKQLVFLKPKKMTELLEEQYLLAGKQVYGIVTVREIIDDFDFANTFKYHQMTESSRVKNWGDSPLYMYIFDYQEFDKPVNYTPEPGAKNIINIRNPKI
jgi:hypothetical protein